MMLTDLHRYNNELKRNIRIKSALIGELIIIFTDLVSTMEF